MPHRRTSSDLVWVPAPPATPLRRLLSWLPALVCWTVLLGCCVGVMAILARAYEPRLDVLTPFIGHFIGFGIAAAAALWVESRRILLLAFGVVATLAAHAAPLYVDFAALAASPAEAEPIPASNDARPTLKVVAFNVWSQNVSPSDVVAVLAASDADVVMLSEVDGSLAGILKPLAALFPYRSQCTVPVPCKEVVLSRLPVRNSGGGASTSFMPGLSWAEIELPDASVVTAVAVHLHRPTLGWRRHSAQIDGLLSFLRDLRTPLIVGGDFNVTPLTVSFSRIAGGAGLQAWSTPLPSWPALGPIPPQFGIDHILVSPDLQIEAAGVGDPAGSDHRPVWSRIGLRHANSPTSPMATWLGRGGI